MEVLPVGPIEHYTYTSCDSFALACSNAQKRLNRLKVEVPSSFKSIAVREDVAEKIDAFLLAAGRFRHKAALGKTNWSRSVVLYSRAPIDGIEYTPRSQA